MLQQPERFKGQQKSPGASAKSSSRCGRRGSTADIRRKQMASAVAVMRSHLVPAGTKEGDKG